MPYGNGGDRDEALTEVEAQYLVWFDYRCEGSLFIPTE